MTRFTYWLCIGVLAYVPFHAFFSTWLIDLIGGKLPVKGLKELVIVLTLLPLCLVVVRRWRQIRILHPWLVGLVVAYAGLCVLFAVFGDGTPLLKAAGLIAALRFFGFFTICYMTAMLLNVKFHASNRSLRVVVLCSVIVVVFGALQVLVLPNDFLANFGYGPATIMPYQTIDSNESLVRILSTLRGPNPLGAYLAMLAPLAIVYVGYVRRWKPWLWAGYGVAFLITLYGSQSRSGWVGLLVGLFAYGALMVRSKKLAIASAAALVLVICSGLALRNTYFVQTTLLHRDPNEASLVDSDDQRLDSLNKAIVAINERPLGHGIGASGPPSNYGDKPFIIENSYLDIAYQVGWLGLGLFMGILAVVGTLLYKLKSPIGNALLAGLIGVSVIGLFWPVWTDETVALTWWGLAGLVLGGGVVMSRKSENQEVSSRQREERSK